MKKIAANLLAFALVIQAAIPSDTCKQETWITDGDVLVTVPVGNNIYIGGDFTQVGPYTGNGVLINTSTGTIAPVFPKINKTVKAVCSDGKGGWFICGDFTSIDGMKCSRIAHILSNGSLDPAWNPNPNSYVYSLALSGTILYAGGHFDTVGGQRRSRIAALDIETGNATPWDHPDVMGDVHSITASATRIYIGGDFDSIGVRRRTYIAALDSATGNVLLWNPSANGRINSIAVSGNIVYVGGNFDTINGQRRVSIAALDSATGAVLSWRPDASGSKVGSFYSVERSVFSIAVSGTTIYVGGCFDSIGGQHQDYIGALDSATGNVTSFNANSNGSVYALAVSGTTVYAGGDFSQIGGATRNRLAALDATTGNALDWNLNANDIVYSIASSGTAIYVGGRFYSIGAVQVRNGIAALDAATGRALDWNPKVIGSVYSIAVSGATVYVGGSFPKVGDQFRNNIAAVDAITGNILAWNPKADGIVYSLAVDGTIVYAGGEFDTIRGQTRHGIAAIDSATGNALSWNPNTNGRVYSIVVNGTAIYTAGKFTTVNGLQRNNIVALDSATGEPLSWNPDANGVVYSLLLSGPKLYAGGGFTFIGGQNRSKIAALDLATGNALPWNPNASGSLVYNLAQSGNVVYAGGYFDSIGGQIHKNIAAIDVITGYASVWNPGTNARVYALAVSGTTVYIGIGGIFTAIGQGAGRPYFAQFGDFYPAPHIGSISPSSGLNNAMLLNASFAGSDFRAGARVTLLKAGQPDINATNVSIVSSALITFDMDITNAAPGVWDAVVANEDSKSDTLPQCFTVLLSAPNKVILLSPLPGATIQADSVMLKWEKPSSTVDHYCLEIFSDSLMNNRLSVDSTLTDTFSLQKGLINKAAYWWRVKAQNAAGLGDFSDLGKFAVNIPEVAVLPAKYSCVLRSVSKKGSFIKYGLPAASHVSIELYNIQGKLLRSLFKSHQKSGYYQIPIGISGFSKGYFILSFKAGNFRLIGRIPNL